jgi:hypothetical protein
MAHSGKVSEEFVHLLLAAAADVWWQRSTSTSPGGRRYHVTLLDMVKSFTIKTVAAIRTAMLLTVHVHQAVACRSNAADACHGTLFIRISARKTPVPYMS